MQKAETLKTIKTYLKMIFLSETKPKINLSEKIKGIKKDVSELWHGFSKLKINESRRGLYNIKNQKKIFRTRNQRDRQKSSRIRKKSF